MSLASHYFQRILDNFSTSTNQVDELKSCIELAAKYLGVSIDWNEIHSSNLLKIELLENYGERLGIQFQPISPSSAINDNNLFYPLLIQLKNSYQFRIYLPGQMTGKKNDIFMVKSVCSQSEKVWQCCPINFHLPTSLADIVIKVIFFFKRDIFRSLLIALFLSFFTFLTSLLSGYLFSQMHLVNNSANYAIYLSIFTFILSSILLNFISEVNFKLLNDKIIMNILPSFWNRILNLPLSSIKKFSSADLVHRIMDYEQSISSVVTGLLSVVVSSSTMLFLFSYMFYCNFFLSLIYLIIFIILLGIKIIFLQKNSDLSHDYLESQGKLASILSESFVQIDKIRSSNAESTIFRRWFRQLISGKTHIEKSVNLEIKMWFLDSLLPVLLFILFYIYLFFYIKTFDTYYCLQLMVCINQLLFWFEKFSVDIVGLINFLPALNRISPIVNQSVEKYSVNMHSNDLVGEIKLVNVSLKESTAGTSILENVSMNIKAGSFVALVGPSGAGKSSIFKLLLGFDQSYSGFISVDDIDMKNIDIHWMRKQFGVVLQTSNIFPGTIFSNISVNTRITLNDAWRLARLVGLEEEISAMPMQMYTHVSDNAGESISGGQKQKILIARALATHPKILFLDEATSALDNASQALIFDNLKSLNITRFVIAHRYSTIVDADMIYVLNNGRIIDSGSYHGLSVLTN